jgi:hypothetical protein
MEQIIKAKPAYLHLFLGIVITVILLLLFWYINIFLYWMQFGEGASSAEEYHRLTIAVYNAYPTFLVICICLLQIYRNYYKDRFSYAKSYLFIAVLALLLFFFRNSLLSMVLGS